MTAGLIVVAVVLVVVVASATFRRARRLAARRLPTALGAELRVHKLECLGEPPARVDLELHLLLGEDAPPAQEDAPRCEAPGCDASLSAPVARRTGTAARRS